MGCLVFPDHYNPWLVPLYQTVNSFNENLGRLEPEKFGYDYTKNEALNTLRSAWLPGLPVYRNVRVVFGGKAGNTDTPKVVVWAFG